MLVPYEVTSGGGSGFNVVGSATKPTSAEPGTVWVNNSAYDKTELFIFGAPSSPGSFIGHTGICTMLRINAFGTLQAASFREIVDGLWVHVIGVYTVSGATLTAVASGNWDVCLADGSWLNG